MSTPEVANRLRKATRLALAARGAGIASTRLGTDVVRQELLRHTTTRGPLRTAPPVRAMWATCSEETWEQARIILETLESTRAAVEMT